MAYWVTSTFALQGEKDLTIKWFRRAIKPGNENKPRFEKDKSLDSLRDDVPVSHTKFFEMPGKLRFSKELRILSIRDAKVSRRCMIGQ